MPQTLYKVQTIFLAALLIIMAMPNVGQASLLKKESSDEKFWQKVDKDLNKQAKAVKKLASKKNDSEVFLGSLNLTEQNKLAEKYNVVATQSIIDIRTKEELLFYASDEYQLAFKQSIKQRAQDYDSFQAYQETTYEGKSYKACRAKRRLLTAGAVGFGVLAVAGGIVTGMLVSNLIAGTAITLRPVAIAFLAMFGIGTPGTVLSGVGLGKTKCATAQR